MSALESRLKRFYGYGRVKNVTVRVNHNDGKDIKGEFLFKRLWPAQGVRTETFHVVVTDEGWKTR